MKNKNKRPIAPGWLALIGCSTLMVFPWSHVQAQSFDLENGVTIDWDTTLAYGAAWRVQGQNSRLLNGFTTADSGFVPSMVNTAVGPLPVRGGTNFATGGNNKDDGNRNFNKGLISSRLSFVTEADIKYSDMGLFVRARGWYDDVYNKSNDNNRPSTVNTVGDRSNSFEKNTRKVHGRDAELLDMFAYGNFTLGDTPVSVRLGQQTVSWGESLFILTGISSAQGPLDITKANVPGVQIKEIFLPVQQAFAQIGLTENLSLESYVQFEWEANRLDESGSYFSTLDYLGDGAECVYLGRLPCSAIQRGKDEKAGDSGQFGVALRYMAESLNNTEFGLYYINYHDKLPQLVLDPLALGVPGYPEPANYHLRYKENINLIGASFGTVIGNTNVSGEVSYRRNLPVLQQDAALVFGALPVTIYTEAPVVQAQLSAVHIVGPTSFADNVTILGEAGINKVNGLERNELEKDKWGWGYTARVSLDYYNIIPGGNLSIPVTWSQNVKGRSAAGQFNEGDNRLGIKAVLNYGDHMAFDVGYSRFMGDPADSALTDRDFIAVSASYSF
ncbi:TPA: DUF1302 domain-containing protein [Pseudomonas aeruginosa]